MSCHPAGRPGAGRGKDGPDRAAAFRRGGGVKRPGRAERRRQGRLGCRPFRLRAGNETGRAVLARAVSLRLCGIYGRSFRQPPAGGGGRRRAVTRVLRAAEPQLPQPAASPAPPTRAGARANGGRETRQVPVVICSHKNSARPEREVAFSVVKVISVCPVCGLCPAGLRSCVVQLERLELGSIRTAVFAPSISKIRSRL